MSKLEKVIKEVECLEPCNKCPKKTQKLCNEHYGAIATAIRRHYEEKLANGIDEQSLKEIVLFIRTNAFLPENNKLAELNKLIAKAIHELVK